MAAMLAAVCLLCAAPANATVTNLLAYAPSPLDNPLRGLMPACSPASAVAGFPHSLQYTSLSVASVMTGPTNFNWAQLEHYITSATNDGCQLVFRPYLDFPGAPTGIPQYLLNDGITTYLYAIDGGGLCPDYYDPNLQAAVLGFIAAMGAKYDNDPRIAFIEVGLLGLWGEWHCDGSVAGEWAPLAFQQQVLAAYVAAFPNTKLLVRYPVGPLNMYDNNSIPMACNRALPIGYHDDSFCTDTLGSAWTSFFVPAEVTAGWAATNKWMTSPIGGQMTPSLWTSVWQTPTAAPTGQDFPSCVAATHATYLLDIGVFAAGWNTNAGYQNALAGAALLGYELYVPQVLDWIDVNTDGSKTLYAAMFVTNTGAAPFYYNWQVELAAVDPFGNILATWFPSYQISKAVPGNGIYQMWGPLPGASTTVPFTLLARVINPLPNGRPFRFANAAQDQTLKGWLTLGTMP